MRKKDCKVIGTPPKAMMAQNTLESDMVPQKR